VIWFHTPHQPVLSAPPYTDGYNEHKDYYGCMTAMDEQMGRLRAKLKELGVEDNTMLWFCSDNGPTKVKNSWGSTGGLRGGKRSLYEGGVRVPGLLIWPQIIEQPRVVSMPCSTSDYFPTILDMLGLQLPDRPYDGISLMPLIKGTMTERPKPLAFESSFTMREANLGDPSINQTALIDQHYKIYSKGSGNTYELYDLNADPSEKKNIAKQYPEVVQRMRATIETWRQSCKESAQGKDYVQK